MAFKVKQTGQREMQIQIGKSAKLTKKGIRQAHYRIGKDLRATASEDILMKPKSGVTRVVRRGSRRFRHTASSPGETFANVSGAARRTLGFDVRGGSQLEFGFRRNQQTLYTKILEASDGLNRPALGNSVKKNQRNAKKHYETQLKKALKP